MTEPVRSKVAGTTRAVARAALVVIAFAGCGRTVTIVSGGVGGATNPASSTNSTLATTTATSATNAATGTGNGTGNGSGNGPGTGAYMGACANDVSWMYGTGLLSPPDPDSTSAGGGCETNLAGHATDPQCCACITCARDTYCGNKLLAFKGNPKSTNWTNCVFPSANGTGGCPKDDPATSNDEFHDCLDACNTMYPGVEAQYIALLNCAACETCAYNCNAYGELAKCAAVPSPP